MKTLMKDVVVLLPGIMGSALADKNGKAIWDLSVGAATRALLSRGGSINDLALSSDESEGDAVKATHLLPNAHIIPYFWKIDGYSGIIEYIQSRFEIEQGENLFEFPYDWRLDNRISAKRLVSASRDWLDKRKSRYPEAKLILIAHSMGGLVARYYTEILQGWRNVKLLITLGTPHRGSMKALDFLVNGLRKNIGSVTLLDLTKFVRSCPSVYQLLPIYKCVGKTEMDLIKLEEMNELGDLDMPRAHAGIAFHREIERAVEENSKNAEYQASGYRLVPVVGAFQPTDLSGLLTNDGIQPIKTYKGEHMLQGDGTVPRFSATPIELSNAKAETFVACPHAGLQNFDPVRVQIRATLSDVDIKEIKAPRASPISLDMPDAFVCGHPVRALACCDAAIDPIQAVITNLETGTEIDCNFELTTDKQGWQKLEVAPLVAGDYRIRINAGDEAEPITDVFSVLD